MLDASPLGAPIGRPRRRRLPLAAASSRPSIRRRPASRNGLDWIPNTSDHDHHLTHRRWLSPSRPSRRLSSACAWASGGSGAAAPVHRPTSIPIPIPIRIPSLGPAPASASIHHCTLIVLCSLTQLTATSNQSSIGPPSAHAVRAPPPPYHLAQPSATPHSASNVRRITSVAVLRTTHTYCTPFPAPSRQALPPSETPLCRSPWVRLFFPAWRAPGRAPR
jgi:hypothetical protein